MDTWLQVITTYLGAATNYDTSEPGTDHLNNSEKVVVKILYQAKLSDRGYKVNIDNWYHSFRLVEYLFFRNTGVCDAVRIDRGIPKALV